ncbi:MAG: PhnD/SsuA/transferrin family substrate-binding protein [Nannocystaceae bacterium]
MLGLVLVLLVPCGVSAALPGTVAILVLKEKGVGTTAQAQPHVDRLMGVIGGLANWEVEGRYLRSRSRAVQYIKEQQPQFALLSLSAFLAMRVEYGLEVLGKVEAFAAGGRRYFFVSRDHDDVGGCRGATVASDHLDDPRFVERVVMRGAFRLAEFEWVRTRRPVQTLKKVMRGEATCALIDDAQYASLATIDGADQLKAVWRSKPLPPMAVVAFRNTTATSRRVMKRYLAAICQGDGAAICEQAGLRSLVAADRSVFAGAVLAYGPS